MKRKVVFISHTAIGSDFRVGSHHLTSNILDQGGFDVYHISTPISPFHFFYRKFRKRLEAFYEKSDIDIIPFFIFPIGKLSYFDFSNVLNYANKMIFKKILREKVGSLNYDDILVIDQPYYIPYLVDLPCRFFYRPTDIIPHMVGKKVVNYESVLKNRIDGLIATSGPVLDYYKDFFKIDNCILLENGVPDFFLKPILMDVKKRSGVVYVGAFDYRFDYILVFDLADKNPNVAFDLYGPIDLDFLNNMKVPRNVRFKGSVNYSSLPDLLEKYKIGILPFNEHPSNNGRSPMKVYEYLSRGVMVLSKNTEEIERRKNDFIWTYEDIEGANVALKNMIEHDFKGVDINFSKLSWSYKAKLMISFISK